MPGRVFVGKPNGFGGRRLMNVAEGKPTMACPETLTDTRKQMEKKIPRQCHKNKGFEAPEMEWLRPVSSHASPSPARFAG